MIPLQLIIEGIYSYQERQTIDFTELTAAGLFGIFGQVGSGKSSILEAISYALYGETERLNARDRRAYNMLNLKSNHAYVAFDFINFENLRFRAEREFRRNSKNFGDVKPVSSAFYEWKAGVWVPREHTNAEQIVGLSYENFKRTIIIPQGQFKEFLELGAKDRTEMMKEIFNLHRYDLQDKTSRLARKNQSELDVLQGKLSGFDDVTQERIDTLKEDAEQQTGRLVSVRKEQEAVSEDFQRMKSVKDDYDILFSKRTDFEKKQEKKARYDEKKIHLERYENVYHAFHQLLVSRDKNVKETLTIAASIQNAEAQFSQLEKQSQDLAAAVDKLRPDYQALPQKRREEADLELIAQSLGFEDELKTLRSRVDNGGKKVNESASKEQHLRESIEKSERELQNLIAKRIDPEVLLHAGQWFTNRRNLLDKKQTVEMEVKTQRDKMKEIESELSALHINSESFEDDIQKGYHQLEIEKRSLEEHLSHYRVQQQLAAYAHELHDGEPCPLCGSPEHPQVAGIADTTNESEAVRKQIAKVEVAVKTLQQKETRVKVMFSEKASLSESLTAGQEKLRQVVDEISQHQQLFVWKDFHPDNPEEFGEKQKEALKTEKEIREKNKSITDANKALRDEQANGEKYRKLLEDLKLTMKEKETQINQNQSQLKELRAGDFAGTTKEEVRLKLETLSKRNNATEQTFERLTSELNDLRPKLAAQMKTLELLRAQKYKLVSELSGLDDKIQTTLLAQNMGSVGKVREILKHPLDIAMMRKEIQNFTIAFETLRNSISELEEKLKGKSFDESVFKAVGKKLSDLNEELAEKTEKLNVINAEVRRLSTALAEKLNLTKKQTELQKRADNLRIMTNLFKGAGFVQYVSSVYLRQLCDHANLRFHRMTRYQLSLQLNGQNDFEVIDYLNGGKGRSVKTLSGGQSFQASLSLALALAESVQSDAKANKNFFFIDEGFGTQDAESVNIVFDTLMELQKENRIVGIISHVEELKERIPVALKITRDTERGSLITPYD